MGTQVSSSRFSVLTMPEYRTYSTDKKIQLIENKGILIDDYIGPKISVYLYYLSGFFVEVTVANEENRIMEIAPFLRTFSMDGINKARLSELNL